MKKQIIIIGLIAIPSIAIAQKQDTLKIREIEDVNLHKNGNPNKAKTLTTKSNLTVMENPQPIAIITHEIIESQQAKQLSDVLQNVNGMYITSSRGNSQDSFGGRGFILGNDNIFKNGSRINSGVFPEISGLERVEVLKGSNAMLYGNTAAGGIVNMITKKPRFNFGGSAAINYGSWNTVKPTIDFYGPLSKNVAFRINGAYESAESYRDIVTSKKHYFNPSFLFNLGQNSQLILEADYLKNDFTPDFGIGAITNKDGSFALNDKIGRNTFFGTDWQYQNVQQASTTLTFNHQFSENWALNSSISYQNYTKDYFSSERVQWGYDKNDRLFWNRPLSKTYNEQNYGSAQINVNGSFNTGNISHKILIGADADYNQSDSYSYTLKTTTNTLYLDDPATWASIDQPESSMNIKNRINTRRVGAYIQDYVGITSTLKLLAGLRWSYLENMPTISTNFKNQTKQLSPNTSTSDAALSPKVGLVFIPSEQFSLFGTYTNSFVTNTGYTSDGFSNINTSLSDQDVQNQLRNLEVKALQPTNIDQFEIGAKSNLLGDALSVNITAYQITHNKYFQTYWFENTKGQVVTSQDTNLKEFAGKMRSRGVELDITGKPNTNLTVIGGFSYNNAVYIDTPEKGFVEKQRLVRTPATTANLSAFYSFTNALKGFRVGASYYFIGDRLAGWNDSKSTLTSRNNVTRLMPLDDYSTVSFSLGYETKKFSIQGKINNVFNTLNYNVHENYSVNPIPPRNFYMTFTYKL